MQAGDFVVVKGHGVASDLVETIEHSHWTHVLSVLDGGHYIDPVWPYIVERAGTLGSDATHFAVRNKYLTDAERAQIATYLRPVIGQHYGLKAFIWAGLTIVAPPLRYVHDPIKTAGKVCSTTLAWAYYLAGRDTYAKLGVGHIDPEAVTPADLALAWGADTAARG